jgi:hypothetical protein
MNRIQSPVLVLVFCLLPHAPCLAGESSEIQNTEETAPADGNAPDSPSDQTDRYWRSIPPEGQGFISLAHVEQPGRGGNNNHEGLRLSWGGWGEDPYRFGVSKPFPNAFGIYFWLGESKSGARELWTAGLGGDLSFLALGPVRVFPRLGLGLAYRTEAPDQGLGGVAQLGLGSGIWLGHHWQLIFAADRDFYFPSRDSNRYSVEVRWLSSKLGFPIAE